MADAEPSQLTVRAPDAGRWRAPHAPPAGASLASRATGNWHLAVLGGWTLAWFAILAPRGGIAWKFFTEGSRLLFGTGPGRFPSTGGLHLYASPWRGGAGPRSSC